MAPNPTTALVRRAVAAASESSGPPTMLETIDDDDMIYSLEVIQDSLISTYCTTIQCRTVFVYRYLIYLSIDMTCSLSLLQKREESQLSLFALVQIQCWTDDVAWRGVVAAAESIIQALSSTADERGKN